MRQIERIKGLVVSILALLPISLHSQALVLNATNSYLQSVRVGLIDEFFNRFNGVAAHPDLPGEGVENRKENLLMLFNLSQFKSKEDSLFVEAAMFADRVIEDSVCLHFEDSTWFALAHCKGVMDGRSVRFDLYLTVEHRKKNMYKWVIANAGGSLFEATPDTSHSEAMLYPDDHETNFLSLRRMTQEQPKNVCAFMAKNFSYDSASVFTYLVYSGKLKIDYVDELEFVFTQVPGYIFNVKYFERERNNAGWLIDRCYKTSDEKKKRLLCSIHSCASEEIHKIDVSDSTIIYGIGRHAVHTKNADLKATYERRLSERIALAKDYMAFMQRDDSLRASSIYKVKMESLFTKASKVFLRNAEADSDTVVTVSEFCDMVIGTQPGRFALDSIAVPVWNDKLLSHNATEGICETSSSLRSFSGENPSEGSLYSQTLYIYKEDTEDGEEWLPAFGDLIVRVKKE